MHNSNTKRQGTWHFLNFLRYYCTHVTEQVYKFSISCKSIIHFYANNKCRELKLLCLLFSMVCWQVGDVCVVWGAAGPGHVAGPSNVDAGETGHAILVSSNLLLLPLLLHRATVGLGMSTELPGMGDVTSQQWLRMILVLWI